MDKNGVNLRNLAHIGDAVWELFVREYTVFKTDKSAKLHKITTERVNAAFQKNMLEMIFKDLNNEETELVRRARNLPIPVARKSIQKDYRMATAFEALFGLWYLFDKERLEYFKNKIKETEFFT